MPRLAFVATLVAALAACSADNGGGFTGVSTVEGQGPDDGNASASYLAITTGGDGVAAGCIPAGAPAAKTQIRLWRHGSGTATFSFTGMCVHDIAEPDVDGEHVVLVLADEDCASATALSNDSHVLSPREANEGATFFHKVATGCVSATLYLDGGGAGPASAAFAAPTLTTSGM